jgi:hypothetical protein
VQLCWAVTRRTNELPAGEPLVCVLHAGRCHARIQKVRLLPQLVGSKGLGSACHPAVRSRGIEMELAAGHAVRHAPARCAITLVNLSPLVVVQQPEKEAKRWALKHLGIDIDDQRPQALALPLGLAARRLQHSRSKGDHCGGGTAP